MLSNSHALTILSLTIFLLNFPQTACAKSVYVISDTADSNLSAYKIQGTALAYQTNYLCQIDFLAVGLALDSASGVLFVTFENQNAIELVNARTMEYVDIVDTIEAVDPMKAWT